MEIANLQKQLLIIGSDDKEPPVRFCKKRVWEIAIRSRILAAMKYSKLF